MMQIYQARELLDADDKPTGKWHFTVGNGSGTEIYPVGYCANDCPGHDTPDEAEEHYHQFELDNVHYNTNPTEQRKCEECGEWTQGVAFTHWKEFYLCPAHQTREFVDQLMRPAHE